MGGPDLDSWMRRETPASVSISPRKVTPNLWHASTETRGHIIPNKYTLLDHTDRFKFIL